VADLEPEGLSITRKCGRCGEPVWIEEMAIALCDSCAGVSCPQCAGTSHGVLFIPPPGWAS
jgi:hypothetical protein